MPWYGSPRRPRRRSPGAASPSTSDPCKEIVMAPLDDGAPAADVTSEFDHNDSEFIRNPHAVYLQLHKSQPVVHSEQYGGYWLLTRYHDVRNALLDWQTF